MHAATRVLAPAALLLVSGLLGQAQDAGKYHVIKRIEVGGDGGWDCLTFDSAAKRLYIARSNRVTVVDAAKGTVAGEIPDTPGVHGVAVVTSLHRGFATCGGDNTLAVFDTETLKKLDHVKVGTRPDVILYDRGSNRVFAFNGGSNDATAVDAATNKVVGSVALGGKPEFAVSDGRGSVFVNLEDKSEIVAFDPQAFTIKSRWPLAPGEGPTGLALDRRNRRLFAACGNGKMVVLDADNGKVVATPAIGKGPDGCAFDRQAGLVFSPNGQDGTLTVVKEESQDKFSVVATVPTQKGARTMAIDQGTHRLYLATARIQAQPAPEPGAPRRRPAIEPGSFVVLVVGE